METEHAETVVEKAVTYVKEALGIHSAEAKPEPSEPEIDTENDLLLNPNAYTMKSIGELSSETSPSPETALAIERAESAGETQDEPRQEEDLRQPTALELNSESARLEDGE